MDRRLKMPLALILGFLAFNIGLQAVDRFVSSRSSSCTVYYEYDGVRECGFLRAEVVKVKADLLSASEYREVMLVNVSGVYVARGGRLDGVAVDLGGCLETRRPYVPRVLLYPVASGLVRSVSRVTVTVAGQGPGG